MTALKVITITEDSEIPEDWVFKQENQYYVASRLILRNQPENFFDRYCFVIFRLSNF